MDFNENSRIVQSYVQLIRKGYKKLEDVPSENTGNLKEVVEYVLNKEMDSSI